jgi:hypothetical protein
MPAYSAPPVERPDAVTDTEQWFVKHGLPYFVPAERMAARGALHPRRIVPVVVAVALGAVGVAVLLALLLDDKTMGPAALTFVGLAAGLAYAVTALRAGPIVVWALQHTLGSLRQLLPTVTRALPLLIVFVTFLFINAEVWHVSSRLDGGVLWLVVLLFLAMGIGFFLVRLPEEIDLADDELDDARIVTVVEGTPMTAEAERLAVERPGMLFEETPISRFERINLTVALVVIQLSQVLLVSVTLLLFLLLFGGLAMKNEVIEVWIGEATTHPERLPNLSVELFQVAVFLSAFSALYISVTAVTDDTYRSQFFTGVMREMERAIAVRAAYNAVRRDRGDVLEDDPSATPVEPLHHSTAADPDPTMPLKAVPDERDRP